MKESVMETQKFLLERGQVLWRCHCFDILIAQCFRAFAIFRDRRRYPTDVGGAGRAQEFPCGNNFVAIRANNRDLKYIVTAEINGSNPDDRRESILGIVSPRSNSSLFCLEIEWQCCSVSSKNSGWRQVQHELCWCCTDGLIILKTIAQNALCSPNPLLIGNSGRFKGEWGIVRENCALLQ